MPDANTLNKSLRQWVGIFLHQSMQEFAEWMNKNELSPSQVGAMVLIYKQDHCQVTSIGERLEISTPASSQLIDRLVQRGLVVREELPDDRRVKVLALTEQGNHLITEGFKARLKWIDVITEALSSEESQQVAAAINLLIQKSHSLGVEFNPETMHHHRSTH